MSVALTREQVEGTIRFADEALQRRDLTEDAYHLYRCMQDVGRSWLAQEAELRDRRENSPQVLLARIDTLKAENAALRAAEGAKGIKP